MDKILIFLSIILILNCGDKQKNNISNCQNLYSDEKIELCLPNNEWETINEDSGAIIFRNTSDGSLAFDKAFIIFMIDDGYDQYKLNAEAYRNEYLINKEEDTSLNIEIISKGKAEINDRIFYDFEMIEKNQGLYTFFSIHKKDNTRYIISAVIKEKDRNGIDKNDFLKFFKSLIIK
tara:strand:- start:199 stop:729 length:531 start_codon:yes stop_codon:yes gene_type:complete